MKKKMIYVVPSMTVFEVSTEMPLAGSNFENTGNSMEGRNDEQTIDSRGFWDLEFDD